MTIHIKNLKVRARKGSQRVVARAHILIVLNSSADRHVRACAHRHAWLLGGVPGHSQRRRVRKEGRGSLPVYANHGTQIFGLFFVFCSSFQTAHAQESPQTDH